MSIDGELKVGSGDHDCYTEEHAMQGCRTWACTLMTLSTGPQHYMNTYCGQLLVLHALNVQSLPPFMLPLLHRQIQLLLVPVAGTTQQLCSSQESLVLCH